MRVSASRVWSSTWLWLIGLAVAFTLRFPAHFILSPPYLMDFEVYRTVAQRLAQEGGSRLYEPATSELMRFKYSPVWAFAALPFGWMSSFLGSIVWAVLTVLWLTLSCWGALRVCHLAGLRAPPWIAAVAVLALLRPIMAEFLNGQVDLLWSFLVIEFLRASLAQRPWRAAVWLSLAIALKLPAAIFLPYLLVRRRLRDVAATAAVSLGLTLAACLALEPGRPLGLIAAWFRVLWSSGAGRAFEIGNQSLFAWAGRFFTDDGYRLNLIALPRQPAVLLAAAAALGLLLLVLKTRARRPEEPARLVLEAALLTVLMVLVSPTVWVATYSALILPLTVSLASLRTAPSAVWRDPCSATAAVAAVAMSVMTHSTFWKAVGLPFVRGESYVFLVLMVLPWFGLALFTVLWRQRSLSAPSNRQPAA